MGVGIAIAGEKPAILPRFKLILPRSKDSKPYYFLSEGEVCVLSSLYPQCYLVLKKFVLCWMLLLFNEEVQMQRHNVIVTKAIIDSECQKQFKFRLQNQNLLLPKSLVIVSYRFIYSQVYKRRTVRSVKPLEAWCVIEYQLKERLK